jgi:hypothetical protein
MHVRNGTAITIWQRAGATHTRNKETLSGITVVNDLCTGDQHVVVGSGEGKPCLNLTNGRVDSFPHAA